MGLANRTAVALDPRRDVPLCAGLFSLLSSVEVDHFLLAVDLRSEGEPSEIDPFEHRKVATPDVGLIALLGTRVEPGCAIGSTHRDTLRRFGRACPCEEGFSSTDV
jgi:hypothetical protein